MLPYFLLIWRNKIARTVGCSNHWSMSWKFAKIFKGTVGFKNTFSIAPHSWGMIVSKILIWVLKRLEYLQQYDWNAGKKTNNYFAMYVPDPRQYWWLKEGKARQGCWSVTACWVPWFTQSNAFVSQSSLVTLPFSCFCPVLWSERWSNIQAYQEQKTAAVNINYHSIHIMILMKK